MTILPGRDSAPLPRAVYVTDLRGPDVDALVEAARGEVLAVRGEGHTVHGLRVLGQRVNVLAALHVPQAHCRVKRRTANGTGGWSQTEGGINGR